ncbi:unnamed protein product [Blepharisma stoltei]|uniref:Uncharacterized protein n=1 Tax=Blepharisma stoltei TaxID=1481888 RepID=A0AAU9IDE2_9CILI|nr:unnamed protein product [Blepharisma stoltei]
MENNWKTLQSVSFSNPQQTKKRAKPVKQFNDISSLKKMIVQYDNKVKVLECSRKALEKSHKSSSVKKEKIEPKLKEKRNLSGNSKISKTFSVNKEGRRKVKAVHRDPDHQSQVLSSIEDSVVDSIVIPDVSESYLTFGLDSPESPSSYDTRIRKISSIDMIQNKENYERIDKLNISSSEPKIENPGSFLKEKKPKEIKDISIQCEDGLLENYNKILKENENLKADIRNSKFLHKNELDAQRIKFEAEVNKLKDQILEMKKIDLQKNENLKEKQNIINVLEEQNTKEDSSVDSDVCAKCDKMTEKMLEEQKSRLLKEFKENTDNLRISLAESHEKEYNDLREQFVKRIQANENRIKQKLANEFTASLKDQTKSIIEDLKSECESHIRTFKIDYENKIENLLRENLDLKKEIDFLESKFSDLDSRSPFFIDVGASEVSSANQTFDSDKIYIDLVSTNKKLKMENTNLQKHLRNISFH